MNKNAWNWLNISFNIICNELVYKQKKIVFVSTFIHKQYKTKKLTRCLSRKCRTKRLQTLHIVNFRTMTLTLDFIQKSIKFPLCLHYVKLYSTLIATCELTLSRSCILDVLWIKTSANYQWIHSSPMEPFGEFVVTGSERWEQPQWHIY